ncbi:MAG: hypothetical protein IPN76_24310 [Saprospiraceae bacterium]|nr:hypothetical protein [Saprospiraceae bacterium]
MTVRHEFSNGTKGDKCDWQQEIPFRACHFVKTVALTVSQFNSKEASYQKIQPSKSRLL